MLVSSRVSHALESQADAFRRAAEGAARLQERYGAALEELAALPLAEIETRLAAEPWPGARPTEELAARGLIVPFGRSWSSAQEARGWALDRLQGITTVAVDGSQIAASKEFGVPVSLVQVAWFENPHDSGRPYVKDVENEVVTSGEVEEYAFAESKLNQRRFALEMRAASQAVERLATDPCPLVLVDGSFVLSFIGRMAPVARAAYLEALFGLLQTSERCRVPVVGYVDLSFAADVTTMLATLFELPAGTLFDARLFAPAMQPFDRTAAFRCARGDVLPYYLTASHDYSGEMCFLYLMTGRDRLPARIDLPRWVLQAGLLDHVVDLIRAEIVVGSGYPYALETADAAAVLTTEDRMAFYRLFHEFARTSGLDAFLPAKSISKLHRR